MNILVKVKNKAQALMELMVFGSIFLMLLGILINYGLRYNQQQRVMQKAFRKALPSALQANYNGTPSVVQHVVVEDIHIPSPNNPFGVGSMSAVSGSASVTRSWTYNIPERDSELPVLRLEIDGATRDYQLAGFFIPTSNLTEAKVDKYKLIYGTSNIDDIGKTCLKWEDEDGDGRPGRDDPIYDHEPVCEEWSYNIRIIDSCAGAIMNYDSAAARCRLILDKELCRQDCFDDPAATPEDCAPCDEDIEIPWYCENYPAKLNQLFSFSPLGKEAQMGLQPDYTETFTSDNVLRKQEGPANIVTTSQVDWTSTKARQVIIRNLTDTSGSVSNQTISSPVTRQKTTTWVTPHQRGGTGGTGGGGGTGGTGGGGGGGGGGGTGGTGGEPPPAI